MNDDSPIPSSPRCALQILGASSLPVGGGLRDVLAQSYAPSLIRPDCVRPMLAHGATSGDVTDRRAIVWSRTTDRRT